MQVLNRQFAKYARRPGQTPSYGHVPVKVLEAHGELDSHLRYILESAGNRGLSKEQQKSLHRIERLLDSLPESILATIPAPPTENWLDLYRTLIKLHEYLEDAQLELDEDEYCTIVQKTVQLAGAVSESSGTEVNAQSMFTLLLLQVHLHRHSCKKRTRKTTRKTTRTAKRKTQDGKAKAAK